MSATLPMIRRRAARILTDAGFNFVESPFEYDIATRKARYIVGAVWIARGASGYYVAQATNPQGGERNLCGAWNSCTKAELDAFLNGVECMNDAAYRARWAVV